MSQIEASVQAELQAKLQGGASREQLLAEAGADDLAEPAVPSGSVQSVMAQVLASHGIGAMAQVSAPAKPVMAAPAKLVLHAKSAAPAKAAVAVAAPVISAETQASQEKVKEMAVKLGVPFTNDLMALGSNSAISDALIEKAVAAGKTEEEINAAMAQL